MAKFPRGAVKPKPDDTVQLLTREDHLRDIIAKFPGLELVGPVHFAEDDLPTYLLGIADDA